MITDDDLKNYDKYNLKRHTSYFLYKIEERLQKNQKAIDEIFVVYKGLLPDKVVHKLILTRDTLGTIPKLIEQALIVQAMEKDDTHNGA